MWIELNNKQICLGRYETPEMQTEVPFIVLESLTNNLDHSNSSRVVHFVKPDAQAEEDEFAIGRDEMSHIHIDDISINTDHAYLKFINGKFYLEDNESDYGTLILVKDSLQLEAGFAKAV